MHNTKKQALLKDIRKFLQYRLSATINAKVIGSKKPINFDSKIWLQRLSYLKNGIAKTPFYSLW